MFDLRFLQLIEGSAKAPSDLLEGIACEFLLLRKRGSLQIEAPKKLDDWAANQIAAPQKKRPFCVVNIENV